MVKVYLLLYLIYHFLKYFKANIPKFDVLNKKKKIYCLLPPIITIIGGVLGVIIYITNKEMIAFASNIWMALEIGLISGASSTGANQIIKQILKSKGENKDE